MPRVLAEHMLRKAAEARAALSMLKALPQDGGPKVEKSRKPLLARFRASASELSIRFDTISAMLPGRDLKWLARYLGCRWCQQSRRLDLTPGERPASSRL